MPKKGRTFELQIPSVLGYEKVAMESAAAVAGIMGFHHSRIEDLKTAVAEACTNAIEHGNQLKKNTTVLVTLTMGRKSLEVNVKDQGGGACDRAVAPEIDRQVEGREEPRGWGMFLIRHLVDEVEFKKTPAGGNVLRMVIRVNR
ncbi:MAG: ATP-binding protein [Calditrichaeota bacterium]|nr:MAG: ATP-binding protein [Calditrichota bacterium]